VPSPGRALLAGRPLPQGRDRPLRERGHRLARRLGDGDRRAAACPAVRGIVQRLDRGLCTSHCHRTRAGVVRPPMTLAVLSLLLAFSPAERAASSRITANEISAHLRFLADDQLEGRKPGSAGDELAIKYLASQLEAMGYKPAGDNGTYLQSVPLIELAGEVPREVTFQAAAKSLTLHANTGMQAELIL